MDAPSPDSAARAEYPIWRKAWRGFLAFLEIIGLKDESREVDQAAQLARFKLYHTEFRKLLTANNSFLETLAEMDERRTGRGFVDQAYVQRKVVRAVADAHAMVDGLQVVSGGRYPALRDALGRITAELNALCQGTPAAVRPRSCWTRATSAPATPTWSAARCPTWASCAMRSGCRPPTGSR